MKNVLSKFLRILVLSAFSLALLAPLASAEKTCWYCECDSDGACVCVQVQCK
jgi:hypothetical protein